MNNAKQGKILRNLKTVASIAALVCASSAWAQRTQLPALNVDKNEISVSGLSSGAYMTVQMHFAHSATFKRGAGVVAGGPLFCAEGSVENALGRCMEGDSKIPLESLVKNAKTWAGKGLLDPLTNLENSPVYMFSGQNDATVRPSVMKDLHAFYKEFVTKAPIAYNGDSPAGHAMVLDGEDESCPLSVPPYIVKCGIDLAGNILQHLYGRLEPRNDGPLKGSLLEFDQTSVGNRYTHAFTADMADSGWAYVPRECADGESCKLHVVFHGCHQNASQIGSQYILNTNYLKWADTNKMVVLFPQTKALASNGCWDWFGYTDKRTYATKEGPQIKAVKMMVDHLSSGNKLSSLPAPVRVSASPVNNSDTKVQIVWDAVPGARSYAIYRNGGWVKKVAVGSETKFEDSNLQPGKNYGWTVRAVDAQGLESRHSPVASATTSGEKVQCIMESNAEHIKNGRAYKSYVPAVFKGKSTVLEFAMAAGTHMNLGFANEKSITTLRPIKDLSLVKFEASPCF